MNQDEEEWIPKANEMAWSSFHWCQWLKHMLNFKQGLVYTQSRTGLIKGAMLNRLNGACEHLYIIDKL